MTQQTTANSDTGSSDTARVVSIQLAIGEESPWHHHTAVLEKIVCLDGCIEVQCKNPDARIQLNQNEQIEIVAPRPHRLVNIGETEARYLLVQNGRYDFISCSD